MEEISRLSADARGTFNAIENGARMGIVPTIGLAELMHISEVGSTPIEFVKVLRRIHGSQHFDAVALDVDILLRMHPLRGLELHDRVVVATALSLGAKLVTQDEAIRSSGAVECIW